MLGKHQIDVYYLNNVSSPWHSHEPMRHLSKDEINRADSYAFDQHRRCYINVRSILKILLGRYTGCTAEDIHIKYTTYGKPFVDGQIEFNVSYSRTMGIIAFAGKGQVGVDIEKVRLMEESGDIVRSLFSESEQLAYLNIPDIEQNEAFFELWTRKEAFIKAIGRGLYFPLNEFSVAVDGPVRLDIQGDDYTGSDWTLEDISPNPQYRAALAYAGKNVTINRYWY